MEPIDFHDRREQQSALQHVGHARAYGYDNAGNTTSFTGVSFTYNNRGRMSSSTKSGVTTSYMHNALGQLIQKGAGTLYYYDDAGTFSASTIPAAGSRKKSCGWVIRPSHLCARSSVAG